MDSNENYDMLKIPILSSSDCKRDNFKLKQIHPSFVVHVSTNLTI